MPYARQIIFSKIRRQNAQIDGSGQVRRGVLPFLLSRNARELGFY